MIPEDSPEASIPDPNPTTAYAALFSGLDFSIEEWLAILNSCTEKPSSCRRREDCDLVSRQQMELWMNIEEVEEFFDVPGFSCRLRDFPKNFRIAILEAIERFWSQNPPEDVLLETRLSAIGVTIPNSAHEKLATWAFRKRHANWTPASNV